MYRFAVAVFALLLTAGAAGAQRNVVSNGLIVFASDGTPERGGDIRTVGANGRSSVNITHTPARESTPVLSPARNRIAFFSDRPGYWAVYVARTDGRRVRRLTGKAVRVNPPGTYAAARGISWAPRADALAVTGSGGVYVVRLRDRGVTHVDSVAYTGSADPSWSANGRLLAYTRVQTYPQPFLVVVTDRGGKPLWSRPGADAQWSPRGARVAFELQTPDPELVVADERGRTLASYADSHLAVSTADAFLAPLPAWSPDGKWLSFVFQRTQYPPGAEVSIARVGEWTRRRVGDGVAAAWAPDSRRIAYTHYAPSGFPISVRVFDLRRNAQTTVADDTSVVAWSPNGRRLAVADAASIQGHHVNCGTVFTVSPDGSRRRRSVQPAPGTSTTWAGWAAGGTRIVYREESGTALFTINADGSARRRLRTDDGCGDSSPAWSPDGRRIAFSRETVPSPSFRSLYVRGADSSDATPTGPGCCEDQWGATWAPDATRIAYSYDFHEVVASPVGSASLVPLFTGGDDPTWSPDGQRLAFVGRYGGIWVGPSGGGDATRIGDGSAPAWSPAGDWIAYTTSTGNAIRAVHPDGSGDREIHAGPASEPAWSPDGRLIVYVNAGDLWVVGADGSGNRRLTSGSATDASPHWQPVLG